MRSAYKIWLSKISSRRVVGFVLKISPPFPFLFAHSFALFTWTRFGSGYRPCIAFVIGTRLR